MQVLAPLSQWLVKGVHARGPVGRIAEIDRVDAAEAHKAHTRAVDDDDLASTVWHHACAARHVLVKCLPLMVPSRLISMREHWLDAGLWDEYSKLHSWSKLVEPPHKGIRVVVGAEEQEAEGRPGRRV